MIHRGVLRKAGRGLAPLLALTFLSATQVRGGGLTAIASFNGSVNGNQPYGVTADAQGNLYGTTAGGANGYGAVWEIPAGSHSVTTLATFNLANGAHPEARVTIDANGNLYGTTTGYSGSGPGGDGTVWELARGSGSITTLASFNGTTGTSPFGGVTADAQGNLYGTASGGGASGVGTVWELKAGSGTLTALASFNGTNGSGPSAGTILDSRGNLFGTAASGGASNDGTVWELKAGSGTLTALASFNGTNGSAPNAVVTMDAQGNLYGTAGDGGSGGDGTVWELKTGSSTLTALASFDGANGAAPDGGVAADANGNIYGAANLGGSGGAGTVWELAAGSGIITALASFDVTTGTLPISDVTLGADGDLYGTAASGGAYGGGTAWQFQLSSVPEPSSLVLGLIGLAVAGGAVRLGRRHRS